MLKAVCSHWLSANPLLLFVTLVAGISLYLMALILPIPTEVGLAARHSLWFGIIYAAFILYPSYRLGGAWGSAASLITTLILFALPLAGAWNSGVSEASFIGGLLPFNDANGYYSDAKELVSGFNLSVFASRRPLFTLALSSTFWFAQQNLQVALAIWVGLSALASYLLTCEIRRTHGSASSVFVLLLLFLYYRRFAGTTLTENIGFPLGAIGLTLLWHSATALNQSESLRRPILFCASGSFFLALALNARAGAFFVLPAILAWVAFICWQRDRQQIFTTRLKPTLYSLSSVFGAILLAFIINQTAFRIFGNPDGATFSNFSYTLYGLAVGGKNWTQVLIDHPGAQEHEIYGLAMEALRQNPTGIIWGSLKAWYEYFDPNALGAFSFVSSSSDASTSVRSRQILYLLSYVSFAVCLYRFRKPENSLMIFLILGIVLSVPFVPPWDADSMRAYAATIPISATLPALCLAPLFRRVEKGALSNSPYNVWTAAPVTLLFGTVLLVFLFLPPLVLNNLSKPIAVQSELSCRSNESLAHFRIDPGSYVQVVNDDAVARTRLPFIRVSEFRDRLEIFSISNPERAEDLAALNPPFTLLRAFLIETKGSIMLVTDSNLLPKKVGRFSACGQQSNEGFAFFEAQKIQALDNSKMVRQQSL